MGRISYRGYRFPPDIIQRAVWLYFRFTLSFWDVEDLLAERSIEVSYETIRQWVIRFGPAIAQDLRSRRPRPHGQWHLDEMFVSIGGKWMYLWRAVDAEGEVLDCLVQSRRDKRAAQETDAEAPEEAGLCSEPSRHRPFQVLSCGFPGDAT